MLITCTIHKADQRRMEKRSFRTARGLRDFVMGPHVGASESEAVAILQVQRPPHCVTAQVLDVRVVVSFDREG